MSLYMHLKYCCWRWRLCPTIYHQAHCYIRYALLRLIWHLTTLLQSTRAHTRKTSTYFQFLLKNFYSINMMRMFTEKHKYKRTPLPPKQQHQQKTTHTKTHQNKNQNNTQKYPQNIHKQQQKTNNEKTGSILIQSFICFLRLFLILTFWSLLKIILSLNS